MAIFVDYGNDNPCDRIGPVLGPQQDLVRHMRALPHRDVAAAVETVRASGAAPVAKLAFEFLVLTAARSGEVRGAQWDEIDTADHVWTVPGDADEGEARAPRAAVPARRTDPRRGADAQQRQPARVLDRARQAV